MSASVDGLLVSLQLADSAFPSGLYTLSHGLEGYLQARRVDAEGMPRLLTDLLRHSVGPADATALALAHRAVGSGDGRSDGGCDWDAVVDVDRRLFASKLNREARQGSTRTGRQMLDTARLALSNPKLDHYAELVAAKATPGCQPVAAGVAYASSGVPAEQAVASDLFAFATSFVSAGLRLRLTDHRRAQVTLRELAPVIAEVVAAALERELADLGGCVPLADAMSGRHERAEARMFVS